MKMKTMTVAVATVLLAFAFPAWANVLVSVQCTSGQGSGAQTFELPSSSGNADWTLPTSFNIMSGTTVLAKVTQLSLQTDADPFVNLRFAVEAGAADTTFAITSTVVGFAPLADPTAYASAGTTLTSDGDGATITGLFDGKCYRALYNTTSVYADLVNGFTEGPDRTVTASERDPALGFTTIVGSISSIQSEFNFTLSALDQASGTSRFEVVPTVRVPEPVT
ncbi:MAG: hypothetical protein NT031_13410, partial [Planctomycetota bacterium]|nr:hypothetical protein [Planctomycetota bacterium]